MERTIFFNDSIDISSNNLVFKGQLVIPEESQALILFLNENGELSHDERVQKMAERFQNKGLATLYVDLNAKGNTLHQHDIYQYAEHVVNIRKWVTENPQTEHLNLGILSFGSGSAAAIEAIVRHDNNIYTMVSVGGRPDLAKDALKGIEIPMLFICGDKDNSNVVEHEKSLTYLNSASRTEVLHDVGAGFQTPEAIDMVFRLAREWFIRNL